MWILQIMKPEKILFLVIYHVGESMSWDSQKNNI